MTNRCLKSISPDALTGMIFALEGMRKTVVLLNGPMGCRFYHSTTSPFLTMHPILYLPTEDGAKRVPVDYAFLNDWFFRQERVPSTYLDGYDYVYGTKEKVTRALRYINRTVDFDLLAIVNSPGAALIGDNLLETARAELGSHRCVMLESPGFSDSFELGYSEALRAILSQVGPTLWDSAKHCADCDSNDTAVSPNVASRTDGETSCYTKKSVNVLGLCIWQRYHEGDLLELRRLFALCGIHVNACPCASSSIESIARMPKADLNVVLYPEMGEEAARYLQHTLGTPYYCCPTLPVGFAATERMFADVCELLDCDDKALRADSERARAIAWYKIRQVNATSGKPKGVTFHVDGNPSQVLAYGAFLKDYLGMTSASPEQAELVFADANLIAELMLKNSTFCGIEINQPTMGYIDLVPKTHLGVQGALLLVEQALNGLMSRL